MAMDSKASFAQDIKPEDELRRKALQLIFWFFGWY
jgi:hypothetical protein